MDAPSFGRQRPEAPKREPLLTLGSRPLPMPVRAALTSLLRQLSPQLDQGLTDALDALEQALFRHAEQARSNDEQQLAFESLRETRRVRTDLVPGLMAQFESALASLTAPRRQSSLARPQRGLRSELSLVDASDLEESLVLIETANRAESRASQALFALGMRFATLAEAPLFEPEDLPIGPHRLSDCIRRAADPLTLPVAHRVLFFRCVDQTLFAHLDRFFDEANRILIEHRVLPDLFVMTPRARREPATRDAAAFVPGPAAPPAPATIAADVLPPAAPTPDEAAATAPTVTAPSAADAAARFQQRTQQTRFGLATPPATTLAEAETGDAGRYGAFQHPLTGWPGVPGEPSRAAAPTPPQDHQVFDKLRHLLSSQRQTLGLAAPPSGPNTATARSEDVWSVLGVLQQKPAMPLSLGGKLVARSVQHVKQDVLNQLRQMTPEGRIPRLSDEDADVIDLVGLLFENLTQRGHANAAISQWMTKLQIPLLRVALRDKRFFSDRSHPARQLLNTIAESGAYWFDEGDEDRPLAEKLQGAVDRVVSEFQEDPSVFGAALGDLSRHLQTHAKKSEVAERRHVDAARGREKLEQARLTATQAITERMTEPKPRALIRTLLEQAWTDVLALTLLRQGEASPLYRDRIAFVDALIAFGRDEPTHRAPELRAALRETLDAGLMQIGFHSEDIQSVGDRLFGTPKGSPAPHDDSATLTEVAARLKAHSRFGEEGDHHAHARPHLPTIDPPLIEAETALLARLKTLPFGTWFEVVPPEGGERVRRKLSWFSTLTGRCLFVNQRGARTHETSLEQLARDLHEQRARVFTAESDGLIDRAIGAIMRKLKSIAGQPTDPAEAT